MRSLRIRLNAAAHLVTQNVREFDVQNNHRRLLLGLFERLLAGCRFDDLVSCSREGVGSGIAIGGAIVDNQHSEFFAGHWPIPAMASTSRSLSEPSLLLNSRLG